MQALVSIPRTAIFLAGMAAGAVYQAWKKLEAPQLDSVKQSIAELESKLASQLSEAESRFASIEKRLDEQDIQLQGVPSTVQIVAAMEELMAKTMSAIDEKLAAQAHSIEVLKTTVSQTDDLLERVLESLDSLRPEAGRAAPPENARR